MFRKALLNCPKNVPGPCSYSPITILLSYSCYLDAFISDQPENEDDSPFYHLDLACPLVRLGLRKRSPVLNNK